MIELTDRREPIDLVTLSDYLKSRNELDAVGGSAYLASLSHATPTAVNVVSYARIVREKSEMRKALRLIRSAEDQIYISDSGDFGTVRDDLIAGLFGMDDRTVSDFRVDGVGLEEAMQRPTARKGFYAPIPTIDGEPGLVAGELIIHAGRPGMGKSSMMCNVAAFNCLQKKYRR